MFLFQVIVVCGYQWEGNYEYVAFNTVGDSSEDAIAFASNHFREKEGELLHHYDFGSVKVVKTPLGVVTNETTEVVWSSDKNHNVVPVDLRKLAKSINQEGLNLLFDGSIPSEVELDPYFCWSPRTVHILDGGSLHQSFIQSQKAQAANDLEWHLYQRYEM